MSRRQGPGAGATGRPGDDCDRGADFSGGVADVADLPERHLIERPGVGRGNNRRARAGLEPVGLQHS
jgi:hypothetical protein